jgi:hypothetical protein
MTMAEETPKTPEKSFRDWLADALAEDQQTWDALEEKLKKIKAAEGKPKAKPEPAPLPPRPLDW